MTNKFDGYSGKHDSNTESSQEPKTSVPFMFHPISLFECERHLNFLKKNKSIRPSNIPACALKDGLNIITEHHV